MSTATAALALALLLGLQPLTTDVYLPALPLLARELGASMAQAQLTLAALIGAFGVAQLVWGPVADRVGRRPVLLAGLALHLAASAAATAAPAVGWLVGCRMLQGVGLAAAVVVARAMVRDLYAPAEGTRVMSLGLSGLGLVAILGPLAGGAAAAAAGWRAPLALVTLCVAATLAFVLLRVPETLATKNPAATRPVALLRTWAHIARHRVFVTWAALVACTYGGLYTLLAGSSFVYIGVHGLTPAAYGAVLASASLAYLAGTFACRRWMLRHGIAGAVARGGVFTLAGGGLTAAAALAGLHAWWALALPQLLYCFGHGVHQPCGQAGAAGPFPQTAGAASALSGFILAAVAFAVGAWLGRTLRGDLLPYALALGWWSVATATVAWTLVRRLPAPAR